MVGVKLILWIFNMKIIKLKELPSESKEMALKYDIIVEKKHFIKLFKIAVF